MTQKHYRHNSVLDEQVDLTDKLMGIRQNLRTLRVPLVSAQTNMMGAWEREEQVDFTLDEIIVDYGMVGVTKRRERVVETKQWGHDEHQFIETWMVHYYWYQPTHVDGSKIE